MVVWGSRWESYTLPETNIIIAPENGWDWNTGIRFLLGQFGSFFRGKINGGDRFRAVYPTYPGKAWLALVGEKTLWFLGLDDDFLDYNNQVIGDS